MTGIITEMRRIVEGITNDPQVSEKIVYALVKNLGGDRLYIPMNDYERRNSEIKSLYRHGATTSQLAKRYRLADRTIRRIITGD
jgi:Mor family transcriptional regulator